ncbi:MAG: FecCD family ABC transporter permease [Lachnospiraceae bacterium]
MKTPPTCSDYNKKKNTAGTFFILSVLLLALLMWNICAGSVQIPLKKALAVFMHAMQGKTEETIIWQLRLPRAVAAILLGGALSLSGYLLQTFFHNPIAGPFVLGISSGAKLFVSLIMVFCLKQAWAMSSFTLIAAAFAGAMVSMGIVLLFSQKVKQMSILVVCGVMIGYICSAITDFVVTFADDSDIVNLHNWSLGSFSGISWDNVQVIAGLLFVTAIGLIFLAKPMRAYQLGEAYAQNLGVNIHLFRCALVLLSSLLSACVTAFAGPVSFVGIAVPQLVKRIFQTAKPQILLPGCFLGGGVFCLFCDLIARTVFAPTELSISTVTAVFGAPVVLSVMIRHKK